MVSGLLLVRLLVFHSCSSPYKLTQSLIYRKTPILKNKRSSHNTKITKTTNYIMLRRRRYVRAARSRNPGIEFSTSAPVSEAVGRKQGTTPDPVRDLWH